jgi:hypothetical protein
VKSGWAAHTVYLNEWSKRTLAVMENSDGFYKIRSTDNLWNFPFSVLDIIYTDKTNTHLDLSNFSGDVLLGRISRKNFRQVGLFDVTVYVGICQDRQKKKKIVFFFLHKSQELVNYFLQNTSQSKLQYFSSRVFKNWRAKS